MSQTRADCDCRLFSSLYRMALPELHFLLGSRLPQMPEYASIAKLSLAGRVPLSHYSLCNPHRTRRTCVDYRLSQRLGVPALVIGSTQFPGLFLGLFLGLVCVPLPALEAAQEKVVSNP